MIQTRLDEAMVKRRKRKKKTFNSSNQVPDCGILYVLCPNPGTQSPPNLDATPASQTTR